MFRFLRNPDLLAGIGFVTLILAGLSTWFLREPGAVPDFVRGLWTGVLYGIAGGTLILPAVRRRQAAARR